MRAIVIKTIPHAKQRYPTVGDYFDGVLVDPTHYNEPARHFRISDMGNPDFEFLVALHELIESHLVQKRGISDYAIDAFDKDFEIAREQGLQAKDAEPGDDPQAPYHREHVFATTIEKWVARELGVDWQEYGEAVMSL